MKSTAENIHPMRDPAKIVVIGFGLTGQSVIRYLSGTQAELIAMDTRELAPNKLELASRFPNARLVTGGLDQYALETADMVVVSPGISVKEFDLPAMINPSAEIVGDIELFARVAEAPIIAITGSNGKSTVATLTHIILSAAGMSASLGGNIGVAALDLLAEPTPDVYVLELSSFQLETTESLKAATAVVLNLSEDHMDRYDDFAGYVAAKARIYKGCQNPVVNRDDLLVASLAPGAVSFGLDQPSGSRDFGVIEFEGEVWLAKGNQLLMAANRLQIAGHQNIANVLAAMALADQLGAHLNEAAFTAIAEFKGLPNRCEQVAVINGVTWVNDSKGTNVGATCAAIRGFDQPKIMILGGQGKSADFLPLRDHLGESTRAAVLIGEDAGRIDVAIGDQVSTYHAGSLQAAVEIAANLAQAGDVVLFSPACASFDMFENFVARGDAFRDLVQGLEHV